MRFSQKGAKSNKIKLVWSKYFKYSLEGKEYFIKQKAYTTHHDGWIDSERIKERTYKNAIKRGNECIEIILEEDMMESSLNALAIIYNEEYGISEEDGRDIVIKTRKVIKNIRKDSEMNSKAEYKIFKRMAESHIKQIKGE